MLFPACDTFCFGASLELQGGQPTDSEAPKKSTRSSARQPKVIKTIDMPTDSCSCCSKHSAEIKLMQTKLFELELELTTTKSEVVLLQIEPYTSDTSTQDAY